MRIEAIDLTNYGPFYGTHSFKFSDRGLVLVMGDNLDEPKMNSNGAGKSSIFDGLDWCLFGKVPRGDHTDSICNDEAKNCQVKVELTNDVGETAYVIRSRGKKSTLMFVENGVDKTTLDTKETQKLILDYLGLDRDVFHSAVLFGQTDLVHYAESTDSERMEILTKILRLDEIDSLLEKTKGALAVTEANLARVVADLQAQQAVLTNYKNEDVKTIFNIINETEGNVLNKNENRTYRSELILKVVSEKSTGFQSDIAKKALKGMNLSTKQAWCIAYEFKNVA